jgi:hypothetical protein
MGYIRHHAVIVSGYDSDAMQEAHEKAKQFFALIGDPVDPQMAPLVSPIIPALVNGYCAFFIAPDGSKEGWGKSDEGDTARERFLGWLRLNRKRLHYIQWAEIEYGGDGDTAIAQDKSPGTSVRVNGHDD